MYALLALGPAPSTVALQLRNADGSPASDVRVLMRSELAATVQEVEGASLKTTSGALQAVKTSISG